MEYLVLLFIVGVFFVVRLERLKSDNARLRRSLNQKSFNQYRVDKSENERGAFVGMIVIIILFFLYYVSHK